VLNPPPDKGEWGSIQEARERTRTALLLFYRYYRRTQQMWEAAYRDVHTVAALQAPMAEFEAYLDRVTDDLVKPWSRTQNTKKRLKVTLRHGLRFSTWQSLKNEKLNDERIVELMQFWLNGIVGVL
jgi:hypothetical protein